MTYVHQPAERVRPYDPPRDNVLLVTCMDLRLIDDIVEFMNHDNLCNRYDHVVFAGAALGALGAPGGKNDQGQPFECPEWKVTFENHLKAAVDLHTVKDVYILEYRGCGAYNKVFHIFKEEEGPDIELAWHAHYAAELEAFIRQWSIDNKWPLGIHKFMMDLRGDVMLLPDAVGTLAPVEPKPKRSRGRKKA